MSTNTTVSVIRGGTTIQTGVIAQIDPIAQETQAYQAGQTPYNAYKVFCRWANPDIEHDDKLLDEAPGGLTYRVTGQPRQYRNGLCAVKAIVKALT